MLKDGGDAPRLLAMTLTVHDEGDAETRVALEPLIELLKADHRYRTNVGEGKDGIVHWPDISD